VRLETIKPVERTARDTFRCHGRRRADLLRDLSSVKKPTGRWYALPQIGMKQRDIRAH